MNIPLDTAHRSLVVIPTVADPSVLVRTVAHIAAEAKDAVNNRGKLPIALVLAVNTPDPAAADEAIEACQSLCRKSGAVDLEVWRIDQPIGFGAANNRGLVAAIKRWGGLPQMTVFHNDDAHPCRGWLDGMLAALNAETVHGFSEPWRPEDPSSLRPDRDASAYGPIGIVGPLSNLVAGIQQCDAVATPAGLAKWNGNLEAFAKIVRERYPNQHVTADFISGFCVGFRKEAIEDLLLITVPQGDLYGRRLVEAPLSGWESTDFSKIPWIGEGTTDEALAGPGSGYIGIWDEETYRIAGYEDNDICIRAELASWRCIVAADVFVAHEGHQTFDRLFPEMQRGLRNRAAHYAKWRPLTNPSRPLHLGAVCRLKFEVGHDIQLFKTSLQRMSQIADSISVVLTANPLEVINDPGWENEEKLLGELERAMLQQCEGRDAEGVAQVVQAWMAQAIASLSDNRLGTSPEEVYGKLKVVVWEGEFNERDERNLSFQLAEEAGADWIISFDHDEVVENRLTRRHFERWMRHPDPGVRAYDCRWANHWDHARLVRLDRPWGDGGTFEGGMHGFRLFRLPRRADGTLARPRRIMAGTSNGLHCGNSPDHDVTAKRVAHFTFRHFGYVRWRDRRRKLERYNRQDTDRNPMLTGGTKRNPYAHIIHEQGMTMAPWVAENGIGLHILVHRGETPDNLARLLDHAYSVADRVVLVWTDPWTEEDKRWLAEPEPAIAARVAKQDELRTRWEAFAKEAEPGQPLPPQPPKMRTSQVAGSFAGPWPETGPSVEMAWMADAFGCEWVHQPLNDHLGRARNAGIEALRAAANGIGWSWFMDLDEVFEDSFASMVAVREMAQASDCHGWLFVFANYHAGQEPTRSDSIRIARLIPGMELHGRVHETFDKALTQLMEAGEEISIRQAPFMVHHYGLAVDDEALGKKLRKYMRMLVLELEDDPHNSQAWVSLGMHFLNDGRLDKGEECLNRAVLCAGTGYLAFKEKAFYHLRIGVGMLREALLRTGKGHDFRKANEAFYQLLRREVPDMPILGSARHGVPTAPDVELPDFSPPARVMEGLGLVAEEVAG